MPTYDYECPDCGYKSERVVPVAWRDNQQCRAPGCGSNLIRQVAAPLFKFMGRVTPGGGPDKFTADMLGVPLHDLPHGLRTQEPKA